MFLTVISTIFQQAAKSWYNAKYTSVWNKRLTCLAKTICSQTIMIFFSCQKKEKWAAVETERPVFQSSTFYVIKHKRIYSKVKENKWKGEIKCPVVQTSFTNILPRFQVLRSSLRFPRRSKQTTAESMRPSQPKRLIYYTAAKHSCWAFNSALLHITGRLIISGVCTDKL